MSRWQYSYIPPSRIHTWWGPHGGRVRIHPSGVIELVASTGETLTVKTNGGTLTFSAVLRLMAIMHMTNPVTAGLRFEEPR